MDAQQFLKAFGQVANAPGGVAQLRKLVLQLAIQGQLTAREHDDQTASELIRLNQVRQQKLIQERKLKRQHQPKPISRAEMPWQLPATWEWVRLGTVTNYGDAPKIEFADVAEGTWVLELEDIEKETSRLLQKVRAKDRRFKSTKNGFTAGSVLYGKLRPYLDKVLIADEPGVCTTEMSPISFFDNIDPEYLRWYLKSPYFVAYADGSTYGMNLPRLGTESAREALFPFPPSKEQGAIVAKINNLMALCDKLEAQQQARRQLQNSLRQATLQAVSSANSPHELQTTWASLAANFGRLFDAPEDVVAIKGAILDLAMSGQLINPEHRQASTGAALLEEIAAQRIAWAQAATGQEQKEALAMLKKLGTQKLALPDSGLPEHWSWASLLQVSQAVVDCHNKTAPYVNEGIHLIRTTDIRNGQMDLRNTRKVSEETYAFWSRRMPPKSGDLFLTREAPMGEAAIVPEGEKVCLGQRSMLIRLFPELFSNRFLLYVMQSPSFQRRMVESAIGMTVKHLRVGGVEDLVVPVPPKIEQDRIVTTVDLLFRLCDHYADQLSKQVRLASDLAANTIASLTGITTIQSEEPMKAPQTELIAPLRLGQAPDIKAQAPLATILARHQGQMPAKDLWQRFGGEIDAFYAQLKTEVAHGWILEPAVAEVRELPAATSGA